MRRVLMVLATAVSISLLACGVAEASITLFEPPLFHPGSVNGQSGVGGFPWKSAPLGAIPSCNPNPTLGQYDQEVVPTLSLLLAVVLGSAVNRCVCRTSVGTVSSSTRRIPQGSQYRSARTRLNKVFLAEFAFMPKTPAYQPGLFLSVSPDSGEGSRMSWVGLEDTPDGIRVTASDTPEVDGKFVDTELALLRTVRIHTGSGSGSRSTRGPDNDRVRISVDDRRVGRCFTTWENYYRTAPEQAPPPNVNTPADINSLQFRSSVQGPPALAQSGGYLFDNVSITPSNGPGPAADCSAGPPPTSSSTRRHKRGPRCRATPSRTGSA